MTTAARLTLAQWMSPAFPVGGFAYSHGLEQAVAAGDVTDATGLEGWLADVLERGSGWSDAVLLARALDSAADHAALSDLALALCASRERAQETAALGAAFTLATNALTGAGHAPAPHPVAVGRAAAGLGLLPEEVVALYLQAFAGNLVQAAVRFVPLGQTEGQRVLMALGPLCLRLAGTACLPGAEPGGAAVGADLAAMAHETMETRIFRT